MRRRTLLKLFPSLGLALLGTPVVAKPDKPDKPGNQPDEEFLRLVHDRIKQQYEESVGVSRLSANIRFKIDTNVVLTGSGNPFDNKEIGLCMNFFWGAEFCPFGPHAGVGIFVNYTWLHGSSCSVYFDRDCGDSEVRDFRCEPLPENLAEVLLFILKQTTLSPDMIGMIRAAQREE